VTDILSRLLKKFIHTGQVWISAALPLANLPM